MDIDNLIVAIKLCGSTPKVERCKQCTYWAGGDMSKCIPRMTADAATALSTLRSENERLRAELEQVKRALDRICEYIDSEGLLRKLFCENGNADTEPCICPSLAEHPGYIDSDDCEVCDYFCNSWRGPEEV